MAVPERWRLIGAPLGRIYVDDGPSILSVGETITVVPERKELLRRCEGAFCGNYVDLKAEVERLRAVEKAARVYFREFDHLVGPTDYPERRDLREALNA